ncbi:ABC transporter substrate-binding protein [Anaerosacchariphilus polymeriproducens]|uniref:ABC transporter substrate-binding protein n=2 Tax=Anaerosacchariphilus polymeriproducens TaxID=1812858 RepID=A0A371AVF9_9FIRM|nr:ABC transporter substrate-binding protein [Anaerosacchariphilus polymeriproducens]
MSMTVFIGCGKTEKVDSKTKKLTVAVSIVPEKTFVEAVCKDLVDVVTLVPPGSSPVSFEMSPEEIEKFHQSSLYFTIGVATEEASILPKADGVKMVSLQEEVASVYDDRKFASGERDPHIWLSPKRVKVMVDVIAREMSELDPANKDIYEKNAKNYIQQLDQLDQEFKETLKGFKNKKFIVYHPAFGYLAEDYGLEMFALEQEGKEATPAHLQDMIDLAKKENIKAIFYQKEIDSSQSKAFAEEVGGKTIQLNPLSEDYINNLRNMVKTMAEVLK